MQFYYPDIASYIYESEQLNPSFHLDQQLLHSQ